MPLDFMEGIMRIPGYIPGDKAAEWSEVLGAKKGVVGYIPVTPTPKKKEEVKPIRKPGKGE